VLKSTHQEKIYLNVPFPAKDRAKGLGARWDPVVRKWYVAGKVQLARSGSGYRPVQQTMTPRSAHWRPKQSRPSEVLRSVPS